MSNLRIALDLARYGYYVHPLAPRDKMPLAGGNGSNDATRDEDMIRAWWADTPNANIGISLDKSGIVDIAPDCPEWAARFKANGMDRTLLYTSNSAWHTWYRLPAGGPIARACVSGQYDIMSQGNAVAPGSIHPSGSAYVLHTPLMPVEDLPLAPAWAVEMLAARVRVDRNEHTPEDWRDLPSGAVLAQSRRFQALTKANQQLRAVVSGEGVMIAGDGSVSAQRAVFVNQLIRARYPYNEIRALADHFSGVLESNPKWFAADIDRLIFKYTPQGYSPESTGVIAVAMRGGRHYEITAGELLDRYHADADCGVNGLVIEWTVNEAAERLGVSTGTIKRREAELIADGQIRREYGRVILSPATWQNRSQRTLTPQTAIETTVYIVNSSSDEAESVYENAIGSQFVLPHQDAPNVPEESVCKEQAHTRNNTLPPVDLDPPAAEPDPPRAPKLVGAFSYGKLSWIGSVAPRPRRQSRHKGQRTIAAEMREPMAERQARELDARIERLAASVARAEAAGQVPTKRAARLADLRAQRDKVYRADPLIPTPYRPRPAPMPLETLPEPPAAVAAGERVLSTALIERLRQLKAERQQQALL